ncbi:unnamed protein product [Cylicocyclus nassatus]|uniref:Uncharacterized protein n=1 Tax=Cylicocyclus nassatus TaxID=53992 RepID=A0AA36M7T7_CYLNA|nr:unnamed protein product [Cylicocyclus nassatus]
MTRLFPLFAVFNSISLSAPAPTPDGGSAAEETCDQVDEDSKNLNLQLQHKFHVTLGLNTRLACSGVSDAKKELDYIFEGRSRPGYYGHYFNTTVGLSLEAVVKGYIEHMQSAPPLFDSNKTLVDLLKEQGSVFFSCAMKEDTYSLEEKDQEYEGVEKSEEREMIGEPEEEEEEEEDEKNEEASPAETHSGSSDSDQASEGKIDGPVKGVFCYFY